MRSDGACRLDFRLEWKKYSQLNISLGVNQLTKSTEAAWTSAKENFYLTGEFYTLCISRALNTR